MMKQAEAARYPGSQGDLILLCQRKAAFMRRDAAALATRGVTAARLTAFEAATAALSDLPADTQLDADKQADTQAAQAQRQAVEGQMATMMSQVRIRHDERSPAYKAFGSSGLYNASEGDCYLGIRRLVRYARLHVADYAEQGLTPAQLDALDAANEQYLEALTEQHLAESARATATQARQSAYNAHYAELTALCDIGKGLFAQTDKSKYDDYVLDPAPAQAAAPAPPTA